VQTRRGEGEGGEYSEYHGAVASHEPQEGSNRTSDLGLNTRSFLGSSGKMIHSILYGVMLASTSTLCLSPLII
jgi:hypothetical protein